MSSKTSVNKKSATASKKEKNDLQKRSDKVAYQKRKKRVFEMEKDNRGRIIIFQTEAKEWFKIGWISLLLYRYIIAKRIKRRVRVRNDADFGIKSPTGIVSLRKNGVEEVIAALRPLKIFVNEKLSTDEIIVIDLGYEVTDEDLENFKKAEELKLERLNELATIGPVVPEMEARLADLVRGVRGLVVNMPAQDAQMYGYALNRYVLDAMRSYRRMVWRSESPDVAMGKISTQISHLMVDVAMLGRAGLIDVDRSIQLGQTIIEVRGILKSRLGVKAPMADAGLRAAAQVKTVKRG